MFIYICCAGGGSSSMFCQRLTRAINTLDPNLTAAFADVQTVLKKSQQCGAEADLVFAYGATDLIRPETAFDLASVFDVIFVAPQTQYLLPAKTQILAGYPVLLRPLPSHLFGMMDGPKARELLYSELIGLDMAHGSLHSAAFATKSQDKDLELLVYGAFSDDQPVQTMLAALSACGLRCLHQRYSLETLYAFHSQKDFDLRLLFGPNVTKADVAKVARRIDGVIRFANTPDERAAKHWYADYGIPVLQLPLTLPKANGSQIREQLLTFLQTVDLLAASATSRSAARFETPPPRLVHKHFLFISWNSSSTQPAKKADDRK